MNGQQEQRGKDFKKEKKMRNREFMMREGKRLEIEITIKMIIASSFPSSATRVMTVTRVSL